MNYRRFLKNPLRSTTLRQAWLRVLGRVGVRSFTATSGMGCRYVCHVGDFLGENPFYNRQAFRTELELCAAWLRQEEKPLVFDVGANVGFWSTHLAQMIRERSPQIFAFEPVPETLLKLVESINRLQLREVVHPVSAAVMQASQPVKISYAWRDSHLAQVAGQSLNTCVGDQLAYAAGIRLDDFSRGLGIVPTFIKIDIEGSEISALEGARDLLAGENRPAMLFEFNPITLVETGADAAVFAALLRGYDLHYVDDFEGQRRPFGDPVRSVLELDWVSNLFAVPRTSAAQARWLESLAAARARLNQSVHW